MKRCPTCEFQYLDSDQICDLDGTQLVALEPGAPASSTAKQPSAHRQGWKTFALLIVPGVVFGVILFLVYSRVASQRRAQTLEAVPAPTATQEVFRKPSPSDSPSTTPLPPASVPPPARSLPAKTATPIPLSSRPVSTESTEKASLGMIIHLSDGGTIAADEAWRTKDGIWYRRNGVVTLLKTGQVKSIQKAR